MNYLSHLVGRTLRLTQPLEPARGNPFEPVQAREPEATETPEQQITQRLRPVRRDVPAPAVVDDELPGGTPSPRAAVARLDAVLAQAQAPTPGPVATPHEPAAPQATAQSSSDAAPQATADPAPTRNAHTPDAQVDEARAPAARWAEASATLRRPAARVPLQPARAEIESATPAGREVTAPRSMPRSPARASQPRELDVTSRHAVESAVESSQRPSTAHATSVPAPAVRRAPPLAPMTRAMPPPAMVAAAQAGPDVHISIGSVEIRANTAAAPARAKPAASPTRALRPSLSLSDYLQRRGRR